MRIIKFRGKPIELKLPNGEELYGKFVYGNFWKHENGVCRILVPIDGGFYNYNVAPNTIGQFTGLYDKNGKEIYEGDVLSVGGKYNVLCEFRHGAFGYSRFERFNVFAISAKFLVKREFEVIGNIYDNPELLKGGEK